MTNILIIEDEAPARRKLHRFLAEVGEEVNVIAECETITDAVEHLQQAIVVHLILSDISLRDGNAFEIYEQAINVPPIIFITAYNEYLMNAFETNGIAYLLKPYTQEQFRKAWEKFKRLQNNVADHSSILDRLSNLIKSDAQPSYKKRLAIHSGKGTMFLEVNAIAYFVCEDSLVFAVDAHSQRHMLSQGTLKEIAEVLNPNEFFQINRGELVNIDFVERLERYTKNSIAVKLKGTKSYLITSQSKTAAFKEWIER